MSRKFKIRHSNGSIRLKQRRKLFSVARNLIHGSAAHIGKVVCPKDSFGEDWALIGTSLPGARACAGRLAQAGIH